MAASSTRFTQNSLGQSKTPIDSDHGIYRDLGNVVANYPFERLDAAAANMPAHLRDDLGASRVRIPLQQIGRAHDLAGLTIAAPRHALG